MNEVEAYEDTYAGMHEEINRLTAEVVELRQIEALKDLAEGEAAELRTLLNSERVKVVDLKDALDGMTQDMALMEETIRELSGKEPGPDDYGP